MGGSLGVAAASSGGLGSRFDLDQQQKPKRVHKCPKSQSDSSNGVSRLIQVGHASEVMNNLCDYLISCVNRMHVTHWFCHSLQGSGGLFVFGASTGSGLFEAAPGAGAC